MSSGQKKGDISSFQFYWGGHSICIISLFLYSFIYLFNVLMVSNTGDSEIDTEEVEWEQCLKSRCWSLPRWIFFFLHKNTEILCLLFIDHQVKDEKGKWKPENKHSKKQKEGQSVEGRRKM